MTQDNAERAEFRDVCRAQHSGNCAVPWCDREMDDAHHIIEREEWSSGGYIPENGVAVCNHHHREAAETNYIPPQAFWLWNTLTESGISATELSKWDELSVASAGVHTPSQYETLDLDKWGSKLKSPPDTGVRKVDKYPSTPHLLQLYWHDTETTAQTRTESDDTGLDSLDHLVGHPLVITQKMDGGNCMLVADVDNPVRARNGTSPEDTMRPLHRDGGLYWKQQVNQKLPDRLQVFGEWMWAKHSIHYGCDCDQSCDDVGPNLSGLTGVDDERSYFQVFGVYDRKLNLWLSWPTTKMVSKQLGFPTVPVVYEETSPTTATFTTEHEARRTLLSYAKEVVSNGGEGIVVRVKYPFHYGQFQSRVGKYVRENHVNTDEHWSHKPVVRNQL